MAASPKRQHGRPRGRGRPPQPFGGQRAQQLLAQRKKDARAIARMTPEERTLWRV